MTQYSGTTAGTAEGSGGATGAVQGAAGQAGQKLQEGKEQAAQTMKQGAQQARGQLRSQLDTRSTQAGEQMTTLADTLRSTGDQLRSQGKSSHADMADRVASRVDGLGGYLSNSDADRLLDDIESFARRQPWAVAALGFGIGLVASRFLKASSESRYESQSWSRDSWSDAERYGMALPAPDYTARGTGTTGTPATPHTEHTYAGERPLPGERERAGLAADDPAYDPAFDQPTRTL
jgi:hypothetical protein